MRWRHRWAACALAHAVGAFCASASGVEPLDEAAGVRFVCEQGPYAAVARAERARGLAEEEAARVLPNPSLVATHQRVLDGPTDTETVVGLSVPLGIGGRRSLAIDAARARRVRGMADARATLFEAALAFREAYATAVADQARVRIATEQQAALSKLRAMIQGLAKGGEAAGYDLLRQETLARLHARELEGLRARAAASLAVLSAWTAREVTVPVVPVATLAGGEAPIDTTTRTSTHPRMESLNTTAQAAELDARASRRRWVPDLEIFGGYRATDYGTETGKGIALGLTVPLTFFDHGQGEAARADAEAAFARAASGALAREQDAQLGAAFAELQILLPSVREANELATTTATVRARAEQLYAAGEGSITELLEAYRGTEEAQLGTVELGERIARARLAVMRARGTLMNPDLDRRCGAKAGARP